MHCRGLEFSLPVSDFCKAASLLPLHNTGKTGSASFPLGMSCHELLVLVFDSLRSEALSPLQSLAHLDVAAAVWNLARTGSFLLLRSMACSGLTLFSMFSAQTGTFLLLPDAGITEMFLFLRSSTHLGLPLFMLRRPQGFFLFAFDFLHLESLSSSRGVGCCDPLAPVLDHAYLGSFLLPQASNRFGVSFFPCTASCFDSLLPALDFAMAESSTMLRSLACPEFPMLLAARYFLGTLLLVFDCANFDFCISARGTTRTGGSMDLEKLKSWKVDILYLTDSYTAGLSSSLQSLARVDFCLSTCRLACLEFLSPTMDFATLDLSSFLRATSRPGFSLFCVGSLRADSMLLAPDSVHMGPASPPKSYVKLGLLPLIFAFASSDFSLLARNSSRFGESLSTSGSASCGSTLLLSDLALSGSLVFSQSFASLDSPMLTLGMFKLDLLLMLQSLGHVESLPLPVSCLSMGLSLLALDFLHLDLLVPLHSLAHLDALFFVPDPISLGLAPSLHELRSLEMLLFVISVSRLDALLLVFQSADFDLSMLLHRLSCIGPSIPSKSIAQPGVRLPVFDMSVSGSPASSHNCA